MIGWSLRTRLTVLYGGLFLLAGAVLLGVVYLVVQQRLDQQLDSIEDARLAALREEAIASGSSEITLPDGSRIDIEEFMGEVREEQRGIRDAALETILVQGGVAVVAVALAAGLTGWLVADRSLRPLRAITATTERIAASPGIGRDLGERLALPGPNDEIKRLGDSFDAMLEALDRAFDGQRRFVANASHELRTPLALERALIELEITKPTATPDQVHFGTALLAINDRHAALIEGLLFLADSENEIESPVPVDLGEVAEHVVAEAHEEAREAGVAIDADLGAAPVLGDPILLGQLVRNLVENGIRHNLAEAGSLRITTSIEDDRARLVVGNSGPVLLESETEALFEPFRRGGGDRTAGSRRGFGLGLAIVRAVVTTHGGAVTARPRPQGGLAVTVDLPARASGLSIPHDRGRVDG